MTAAALVTTGVGAVVVSPATAPTEVVAAAGDLWPLGDRGSEVSRSGERLPVVDLDLGPEFTPKPLASQAAVAAGAGASAGAGAAGAADPGGAQSGPTPTPTSEAPTEAGTATEPESEVAEPDAAADLDEAPVVAAAAPEPAPARTTTSRAARPEPVAPAEGEDQTYATALVTGVNAERAAAGLPALSVDDCAVRSARAWAEHLAATGAFEHQDMGSVMRECGVRGVGENIAMTSGSAASMVQMWMDSPGHRENILRGSYTAIGSAAVQDSRGYWIGVHVFVTR